MPPITDVREISNLAYGFIASKVLFAALNARIFELLAQGPRPLAVLERETGIAGNRLDTLLTACTSLGLIERGADGYRNAPASQQYLVVASPMYFGDYFRFQIDRQIYPLLENLDEALRGTAPATFYSLMANAEEADYFSRAQHTGSLGPAAVVAKQVDLAGATRLLDVAGGSGLLPGDALQSAWPGGQDAVLLSYLLSAVAGEAIPRLGRLAYDALRPGGQLLIHDFFVDDDHQGPRAAALWFIASLFNPDAVSLTPGSVTSTLEASGFTNVTVRHVIPGITRLAIARKPA